MTSLSWNVCFATDRWDIFKPSERPLSAHGAFRCGASNLLFAASAVFFELVRAEQDVDSLCLPALLIFLQEGSMIMPLRTVVTRDTRRQQGHHHHQIAPPNTFFLYFDLVRAHSSPEATDLNLDLT